MIFYSALVVCFIISMCFVDCAKILGIFPNTGYSQIILGRKLMKELASRGHEVTMISPYPLKDKVDNYRDISTAGLIEIMKGENLFNLENLGIIANIQNIYDLGYVITEYTLKQEEVQDILDSNEQFDLVLSEQFFNEAHMGFAYYFKTPLILFSSIGANEWSNNFAGNPSPFSIFPLPFLPYSGRMSFWQRFYNTVVGIFHLLYKELYVIPTQNKVLQKYFPGSPHLKQVMDNVSLVLLNSHVSVNDANAHVPNMIEIGGFHVKPQKLAHDLQMFLDDATDGAIYFSMGSNLKSTDFSPEKKDAIVKVFGKLKQKVLWKWENDSLPALLPNLKVGKWLPQQDILAHPNIRLFISHGGLLSTTEAIYCGVPVIGIPIFGDQKMNIATAVANGYAINLPFQELTEENLSSAIFEMLRNPNYKTIAQQRSRIMKDQPIEPIDRAMFWIEYVLRHQGALHLRSTSYNLTWYQYYLVDVVSFLLFSISSSTIILYVFLTKLRKWCRKTVKPKQKHH